MNIYKIVLLIGLMFGFSACDKAQKSGAHTVHFDRDMCEECKMVISERAYAAQIVDMQHNKAYMFDDIGCLVLWMDENPQEWFATAKIYVADSRTLEFIDAKTAYWALGATSPMDFGLSASKVKKDAKNLTFEEAKKEIIKSAERKASRPLTMKKCGAGKCGATMDGGRE
ncbi:MAG: nitrous oxide reductase accessory protein NosL [Thiovulaceae bacterium]|nr:nitrous oxide reductase accessory protein NosL [Sulfurimonadaceae bacterium]